MSTSGMVSTEQAGGIGEILIANPPVNALSHEVRSGLLMALERLEADSDVSIIIVHGIGRHFVAGADVAEFDDGPRPPLLNDVLLRLESCGKPVVSAMHGATLGGGAELALASHFRCSSADLQFGLPEVKLGLIPGAGATVRLPRIVGADAALDLMLSAEPIGIARALTLGLVDRLIDGDLRVGALAYARDILAERLPIRRVRDRELAPLADYRVFAQRRELLPTKGRPAAASARIIECVEATFSQPFADALRLARENFEKCRNSIESKALRHLFFAERPERLSDGQAIAIHSVGVLGAGTMGSGIAACVLLAGYAVVLVDANSDALHTGEQKVKAIIEKAAARRNWSDGVVAEKLGRLHCESSLETLRKANLVIEAVIENLAIKQEIFARLGTLTAPGTILATNTSTLDVDAIASASGRPADVAGMHFFSPAHVMRLVEVIKARETSRDVLATILEVSRKIGKLGVVVGNCFGFVGNRMLYAYGREKELLMLEGAEPLQIDEALEAFGMAMGPNAVGDLAGLDVGVRARSAWTDRPDDPSYYRVSELLVEHGRLGRKSGQGFYCYAGPDAKRQVDPEVSRLIRTEAERLGVAQRRITDEEIVDRCSFALINEGARILDEGIAERASQIDVVWCNGYGFPRTRGGPMFYANQVGLSEVLERMRRFQDGVGGQYWRPAPLLESLAKSRRLFGE